MSSHPLSAFIPTDLPFEDQWAAAVAGEVRLKFAAGADEPPEMRQGLVVEEVKRRLMDVPRSQRARCLARLETYFPTGYTADAASAAARPPLPPTPEEMVKALSAAWPDLTPAQQKQFQDIVTPEKPREAEDDGQARVRKVFNVAAKDSVAHARVAALLTIVFEEFDQLNNTAWNTWKKIAPSSSSLEPDRRAAMILLSRYLAGDPRIDERPVREQLVRWREWVARFVAAHVPLQITLAEDFETRYSPAGIKEALIDENALGLMNHAAKCWQRYEKLYPDLAEQVHTDRDRAAVEFIMRTVRARPSNAVTGNSS